MSASSSTTVDELEVMPAAPSAEIAERSQHHRESTSAGAVATDAYRVSVPRRACATLALYMPTALNGRGTLASTAQPRVGSFTSAANPDRDATASAVSHKCAAVLAVTYSTNSGSTSATFMGDEAREL